MAKFLVLQKKMLTPISDVSQTFSQYFSKYFYFYPQRVRFKKLRRIAKRLTNSMNRETIKPSSQYCLSNALGYAQVLTPSVPSFLLNVFSIDYLNLLNRYYTIMPIIRVCMHRFQFCDTIVVFDYCVNITIPGYYKRTFI